MFCEANDLECDPLWRPRICPHCEAELCDQCYEQHLPNEFCNTVPDLDEAFLDELEASYGLVPRSPDAHATPEVSPCALKVPAIRSSMKSAKSSN